MSINDQNELTVVFTGVHLINANRDVVCDALQNRVSLLHCLPGCDQLSGSATEGYDVRLTQHFGQVSVTFAGRATIEEVAPYAAYSIRSTGRGGIAGYADSITDISLSDVEGGTELSYRGRTILGGFQSRESMPMARSLARNFADQFFEALQSRIEAQAN